MLIDLSILADVHRLRFQPNVNVTDHVALKGREKERKKRGYNERLDQSFVSFAGGSILLPARPDICDMQGPPRDAPPRTVTGWTSPCALKARPTTPPNRYDTIEEQGFT